MSNFEEKKVWLSGGSAISRVSRMPLSLDINMQNINIRLSTNHEFNQTHISFDTEDLLLIKEAIDKELARLRGKSND